ncbi:MAG: DUF2334 domain-containing protein [Acidobacteriota bacterium]
MSVTPSFSVVIHDVAPANWFACQRVMQAVREVADIPMTFLVVPRYHLRPSETGFELVLSKLLAKGHELALHGYSHLDEGTPSGWIDYARRRLYTAGEGEFAALVREEAAHKLHTGIRWFQHRQWPLHGFVAPAWLMSEGSWQAIRSLPFQYTATLGHVYSLPQGQAHRSDCMAFSTRSAWRRALSIPRNAWVSAQWSSQPFVRLELHPHDADFPMIRRTWMRALAHLQQTREAVTLFEGVQRLTQAQAPEAAFDFADQEGPATIPHLHPMWNTTELTPDCVNLMQGHKI